MISVFLAPVLFLATQPLQNSNSADSATNMQQRAHEQYERHRQAAIRINDLAGQIQTEPDASTLVADNLDGTTSMRQDRTARSLMAAAHLKRFASFTTFIGFPRICVAHASGYEGVSCCQRNSRTARQTQRNGGKVVFCWHTRRITQSSLRNAATCKSMVPSHTTSCSNDCSMSSSPRNESVQL